MARRKAAHPNIPEIADEPAPEAPVVEPRSEEDFTQAALSQDPAVLLASLDGENLPQDLVDELDALSQRLTDAPPAERPDLAEIAALLAASPVLIRLEDAPANPIPVRINGTLMATLRVGEVAKVSADVLAVLSQAGATFTLVNA